MRRTITAAALTIALGFAGVAQADEDTGLYLGVGVGQSEIDLGQGLDLGDDTAFKLFGGWRFTPNFAFELAYLDLGAPEENFAGIDVEAKVSGFAPYIVTSTQFGMVELFARLGYLFYDIDLDTSIGSADDSDEDLVYGLGIGVVLGQAAVRLEYEQADVSEGDATAIWLSGAWRF